MTPQSYLCPSGRCLPGNLVIGVVDERASITFLGIPQRIDEEFVSAARTTTVPPEARLRFAEECVEGRCAQWDGDGCGLARRARARSMNPPITDTAQNEASDQVPLPRCGIRHSCRWWAQEGRAACATCVWVIHADPSIYGPEKESS